MARSIDPEMLGFINRGAPQDYLGTREAQCPHEGRITTQEGFRTMSSAYVGFSLPFARKSSTKGKLGSKADLWICSECQQLVL